jgi:hypothetical protein
LLGFSRAVCSIPSEVRNGCTESGILGPGKVRHVAKSAHPPLARGIGVVLGLLLVGALAQPTRASEQSDYKAKFKAGCLAAKQTWKTLMDLINAQRPGRGENMLQDHAAHTVHAQKVLRGRGMTHLLAHRII